MRRALMLTLLGLSLSGCFTTKLHASQHSGVQTSRHIRVQHTFFWGLVSPGSTDISRVCHNLPVVSVRSRVAGLAVVGLWLTAGIWVPVTVTVTCADAPQGALDLDEDPIYPALADG